MHTSDPTMTHGTTPSLHARPLNRRGLRSFRKLFLTLPPPEDGGLAGIFRAEFVGPGWLRTTAPVALGLSGLGGGWGKQFDGSGRGINIVHRAGSLAHALPVAMTVADSLVDRRPCLKVTYPAGSPVPWPWVMDELRFLDDDTLLGLTIVNARPLRRVAFPFLLHHATNHAIA